MTEPASLLEETLGSWRAVRQGVIDELKIIPAERLDFRPTPDARTVRELVNHVLETAMFVTGELARPDTDFQGAPLSKLMKAYAGTVYRARTRARLLTLLGAQMRAAERTLRGVGELALLQYMTWFDGSRRTKLAALQQSIAHEQYHRGQVALYVRLMGLVPALTQAIRGREEGQPQVAQRPAAK